MQHLSPHNFVKQVKKNTTTNIYSHLPHFYLDRRSDVDTTAWLEIIKSPNDSKWKQLIYVKHLKALKLKSLTTVWTSNGDTKLTTTPTSGIVCHACGACDENPSQTHSIFLTSKPLNTFVLFTFQRVQIR